MNVVFNINYLGMEGLGATLISLLRNCSKPEAITFWFLYSDIREKDKINVQRLLEGEDFKGGLKFVEFDAKGTFGWLRPLHGDWTAYGRLLIEKLVPGERALYLDSDLLVLVDIFQIEEFDFKGHFLAAVNGGIIKHSIEHPFFINKLKLDPDLPYFNSGVLFLDLKKWRESDITSKWKKIAKEYPNDFLSADQTILNATCEGEFAFLPSNFNTPWYPSNPKPENFNNQIIHFVGSPKPWDLTGKIIHKGYSDWQKFQTHFWKKEYGKMTINKVKRTWKIKNSILEQVRKQVLNK